jgi:4-hydroxythreonine-4-phosphate dehydrogenase
MSVRLIVSVGCPSGIGPEVSVAAAAAERHARVVLVGDLGSLAAAARTRGLDPARLVRVRACDVDVDRGQIAVWQPTPTLPARDRKPGAPTAATGAAELAWIDAACDEVQRGRGSALVTGPVSKQVIVRSGAPGSEGFSGHTEHLQRRLGAEEVVMAFWSRRLVTSLATTHLPLARVARAITPSVVERSVFWLGRLLAQLSTGVPRLVVAALNPHAGEAGLLGAEEETRIIPGIERARRRLRGAGLEVDVEAVPVAAESAFRLASEGRWNGVVAMYHDQATIPMKLLGFGDAVNVSLGLPIVRTSVDHGTGYDRAGTGTADAKGMRAAMGLAAKLGSERRRDASHVERVGGEMKDRRPISKRHGPPVR